MPWAALALELALANGEAASGVPLAAGEAPPPPQSISPTAKIPVSPSAALTFLELWTLCQVKVYP